MVVTGRVADSALVLGPLVASFGWAWDAWDLLARGSVIGHVLECGCQVRPAESSRFVAVVSV